MSEDSKATVKFQSPTVISVNSYFIGLYGAGIRKVLGASIFSIVRLISKEFVLLVVISNVLAWPLGCYFLHKWLQGYAYRAGFGIEIFIMAGLGTLLIALFAVGLHTVKAAWSNPLESIRYE